MGVWLMFRVCGQSDLTCDGSVVVGAAVYAALTHLGWHWSIATLSGGVAGMLAGLMTGIMANQLRIHNILSGILTTFMLYSMNLRIMGGVPNLALFGYHSMFDDSPFLVALIVTIGAGGILCRLFQSRFGLAIRAAGHNPELIESLGLSRYRVILFCLMLSNFYIGFGGALLCQHQSYADCGSGAGTLITALASIMIGERVIKTRSITGSLIAIVIGSIGYRLCVAFALHADWVGLKTQDLNLITGLIVVAIMAHPSRKNLCFK